MLNGNKKDIVQPPFSSYISFFLFFLFSFILLFLLCFASLSLFILYSFFHFLKYFVLFIFKKLFLFLIMFLTLTLQRNAYNAFRVTVPREFLFCFFFLNFIKDFIVENKEMKKRKTVINEYFVLFLFLFFDVMIFSKNRIK